MRGRGMRLAEANTWENIVAEMEAHLLRTLEQQEQPAESLGGVSQALTTA